MIDAGGAAVPRPVLILRLVSILFLWVNAWAYLSSFIDLWFLAWTFIAFTLLAVLPAWAGWRFLAALTVTSLLPWLVRSALFVAVEVLAGELPSQLDHFYFWWDKNFLPLLAPGLLFWFLTFLALRYPRFIGWERLVNGLLLAGIFWFQGEYKNPTFPHPIFQALAVTGFLAIELAILILLHRPRFGQRVSSEPGSRLRSVLPAVVLLIPLALLFFWFLLSKYEEASIASGGGLMKPDLFRFDFSQFIRLESEISMSEDLVLLFRREGPAEKKLIRRFILSGYSQERGFYVNPPEQGGEENIPNVGGKTILLPDMRYAERHKEEQEFYIVNFDPSSLLALNQPVKVVPYEKWDESSFVGMYKVVSQVTGLLLWELSDESGGGLDPRLREYYTQYGDDEAIRELALKVTHDFPGYFDKINAVVAFLQDNYYYSLKPGLASDGRQLHHFLFASKKGYCSYFAFAMTLMLRSLGIPSRVAVGFFTNPEDNVLNFYPVRANQAHAWVEVWYENLGWIEYDPTSANLAPGEDFRFSTGIPADQMAKLISEIINNTLKEKNESEEPAGDDGNVLKALWEQGIHHLTQFWGLYLAGLLTLFWLLSHSIPWLSRNGGTNLRRRAAAYFSHARDLLLLQGLRKRPEETALDFARRCGFDDEAPFSALTRQFLKARFSLAFTEEDFVRLKTAFDAWKKTWRAAVPLPKRIIGFLFPWFRGWFR